MNTLDVIDNATKTVSWSGMVKVFDSERDKRFHTLSEVDDTTANEICSQITKNVDSGVSQDGRSWVLNAEIKINDEDAYLYDLTDEAKRRIADAIKSGIKEDEFKADFKKTYRVSVFCVAKDYDPRFMFGSIKAINVDDEHDVENGCFQYKLRSNNQDTPGLEPGHLSDFWSAEPEKGFFYRNYPAYQPLIVERAEEILRNEAHRMRTTYSNNRYTLTVESVSRVPSDPDNFIGTITAMNENDSNDVKRAAFKYDKTDDDLAFCDSSALDRWPVSVAFTKQYAETLANKFFYINMDCYRLITTEVEYFQMDEHIHKKTISDVKKSVAEKRASVPIPEAASKAPDFHR